MPKNTLFGMGKHLNLREVIIERKPLDRQAFFASLAWQIQAALTIPVPIVPGPLYSIPLALFLAHESFLIGEYQGHRIRQVSGRESGDPP